METDIKQLTNNAFLLNSRVKMLEKKSAETTKLTMKDLLKYLSNKNKKTLLCLLAGEHESPFPWKNKNTWIEQYDAIKKEITESIIN